LPANLAGIEKKIKLVSVYSIRFEA